MSRTEAIRFEVSQPLPARGSAAALREQLIQHLMRAAPSIGDRFLSDHELTRLSGLSRPTVRKALDDLEREGWIERRHGRGTFVGPRVAMTIHRRTGGTAGKRLARLAVVTPSFDDGMHDWYGQKVIGGIDSVADELHIAIEIMGYAGGDVAGVSRRLAKHPPDVLAFATPASQHSFLVGEARRLGIPCVGAGSSLQAVGVPCATEDGVQGGELAVEHLVSMGHRRIGFVVPTYVTPWVFTRRQGYLNGLAKAGIEPDERLVLWYPGQEVAADAPVLKRYLEKHRPTAVIIANWGGVATLGALVASGAVRVPADLSVVHFDQKPDCAGWLGVPRSTTVALPLERMGREIARITRQVADGQKPEMVVSVPNELLAGDSVGRAPAAT